MQNEKELRAQAQQQFQDYMQKKQQELGRELSDDDLEKVAGGYSIYELVAMHADYCMQLSIDTCGKGIPLTFDEWMKSEGYTVSWFDF